MIIVAVALCQPNCFRFFVGWAIRFEAWRNGVTAQLGSVGGSLFEPLTLRDSVWLYESDAGPVTRVEIASATAEFSWRNLLPRGSGPWFQRLTVVGLKGKIQFPVDAAASIESSGFSAWRWPRPEGGLLPAPERIEAREVDFIFQSERDYVRLADTEFILSRVETGTIRAGQILIKQPWLNRTFHDVHGTTAMQEANVEIANLTLEPGVQVTSLSAELDDLARGRLNLEFRLAAFGGTVRVAAETLSQERLFAFEATGTFSQIGIAPLATFLGTSEAAGGMIKEGKFTFRGPPQQVAKATASLRLEATNFQWESRQWDRLVFGATLMDGRVQIPEIALVQGHNRLNLNGEMPLPAPGLAWWQSEFSANISARIDNLTELSALMLPEFQYAAGKANIDGSIRGKDQQFHGQLIISGTNLKWHNAPIEELHAGVNLNGNECQLTNVSLFNNGDYLRGHGVVNIIGGKQYWGEIHASIEDLAKYAALLQKPILPEPLAGGATINWSGEGSAKGHSGKFSASLRKLRSLGATAALLHPLNADLDGDYAPGLVQFSRFLISDDDSSFTAHVGIGNKALSVQGMQLYHQKTLWLEGDAVLPLDVWNAWPNTTLATLLDDSTVSKINLAAYNLDLREASLLTGWKFPIEGVVLGKIIAEGPLKTFNTSGQMTLRKGRIPLGWSGDALTGVEGEALLEGQTLVVKKFTGGHPTGEFSASGRVHFANLRDPSMELAVTTETTDLAVFAPGQFAGRASLSATLNLAGPCSGATVSGDARMRSLELRTEAGKTPPNFASWFFEGSTWALPAVFKLTDAPWKVWQFDLAIRTPQPVPLHWAGLESAAANEGTVAADLRLEGSGAMPFLGGEATLRGLPMTLGNAPMRLDEATLSFRDGFADDPSISARGSGAVLGERFSAQVTGTLQHPMRFFVCDPPLTETILRAALTADESSPSSFGLRVPAAYFEGVDVAEWTAISSSAPDPVTPARGAAQ